MHRRFLFAALRKSRPVPRGLRNVAAAVLVVSCGISVAAPAPPAACLVGPARADRTMLRTIIIAPGDLGRKIVMGRGPERSAELADFFEDGGTLLVRTPDGQVVDLVNRDTPDRLGVLNSAAHAGDGAEGFGITVTPGVSEVARPSLVPQSQIDLAERLRQGGSIPRDFGPIPVADAGTPQLGPIRIDKSIYGAVIGGFDGVPIASAIMNLINPGTPRPEAPGAPGASLPPGQAPAGLSARSSNAVVAIFFQEGGTINSCNGVQIARGLVLTNLHCAHAGASGHVVMFGKLSMGKESLLPGLKVSAQVRCKASLASPAPAGPRQDFALLRIGGPVPGPFHDAVVRLDSTSQLSATVPEMQSAAWQVQYWLRSGSTRGIVYEKYAMPPNTCRIRHVTSVTDPAHRCTETDGDRAYGIDPTGVLHECDSDAGSSGSPILDKAGNAVIALHRSSVDSWPPRNCAVPAAAIRSQVAGWGIALD